MELSSLYKTDWKSLLFAPTLNTTTNRIALPNLPHNETIVEANQDLKWKPVPLLRRIRNQISLDLSPIQITTPPSISSQQQQSRHTYDKPTLEIKQKVEQIHLLLTQGMGLPICVTPYPTFQQHPFFSSLETIFFYTFNQFKTSGWSNGHSSHNDSYDLTLATTLLQLLFNLIQFVTYIVNSNHYPGYTLLYTSFLGNIINWFLGSTYPEEFNVIFEAIPFNQQQIDKPLLHALLVFTTQEQHAIVVNILERLLSFRPDLNEAVNKANTTTTTTTSPGSSSSSSESPFVYNHTLINRLTKPSNWPSLTTSQWLPTALLFPQQLRQVLNVLADLDSSRIETPTQAHLSTSDPTANLLGMLTVSRIKFIHAVMSHYNKFKNTHTDQHYDDKPHSIDCLCHQTTYSYQIDKIDPETNDDDSDESYLSAHHCNKSRSIIFRDEFDEHEGIYGPLRPNLHNSIKQDLLPDGMTQINSSLFILSKHYSTQLIDAYLTYPWKNVIGLGVSDLEQIESHNKPLLEDKTKQYIAVVCTFSSCCTIDNNNQHTIFFIPLDIEQDTTLTSIIPATPAGLSLFHLISSLSSQNTSSPNTCGHWPTIDSSYFPIKSTSQPVTTPQTNNRPITNRPLPQQDHLRCRECYNSLPYLTTQFSNFPHILLPQVTTFIPTQSQQQAIRSPWFDITSFTTDFEMDSLDSCANQFICDFLPQFFLQPNTDQIATFHSESHHTQSPLLESCTFILSLTSRLGAIAQKSPQTLFIQSKILSILSLLYKYLYFTTQLLSGTLESHLKYFEHESRPTQICSAPPQLNTIMNATIALWYFNSLLWKSSQLQLTSIHRFSPIQTPDSHQTPPAPNQSQIGTAPRTAQQASSLPLVPKTSLTCTTISQTPILFSQPLIYLLQHTFQLVSPLFPDWQEFQNNLQAWNRIKQRKLFSMGNIEPEQKGSKLDRKDFWASCILASLPSVDQDVNLTQQLYQFGPYLAMLDASIAEPFTSVWARTDTRHDNDIKLEQYTHIFTYQNTIIDLSKLQYANTITISQSNIHKTISQCQSDPTIQYAGEKTVHFTQMVAYVINLLQSAALLDLSFVAGTDFDPTLDPNNSQSPSPLTDLVVDPPPEQPRDLGEYARLDHQMYIEQLGSKVSPLPRSNHSNNNNDNNSNSQQQMMKKQINVNHSPKLFKTIILTTLTNLLSSIPSSITADYQYLSTKSQRAQSGQTDPLLYDVANVLGSLGLLESVLPLLILDTHNPVCREWGIMIVKMLTTKITSILGTDLDNQIDPTTDSHNPEQNDRVVEILNVDADDDDDDDDDDDECSKPDQQWQDEATREGENDEFTDNQKRLYFQSEMSKRHNDTLQASSKQLYHQHEAQSYNENTAMGIDRPLSIEQAQLEKHYEIHKDQIHTEQQALRDEILNTPGVRIRTGWESDDDNDDDKTILEEEEEID